jgi:hypothetical protein
MNVNIFLTRAYGKQSQSQKFITPQKSGKRKRVPGEKGKIGRIAR